VQAYIRGKLAHPGRRTGTASRQYIICRLSFQTPGLHDERRDGRITKPTVSHRTAFKRSDCGQWRVGLPQRQDHYPKVTLTRHTNGGDDCRLGAPLWANYIALQPPLVHSRRLKASVSSQRYHANNNIRVIRMSTPGVQKVPKNLGAT